MAEADDNQDVESLVDQAMAEAQSSLDEMNDEVRPEQAAAEPETLADSQADPLAALAAGAAGTADRSTTSPDQLRLLGDVDLDVMIELGRTQMLVEDVLRLGEGSVVELDKLAGDPVDVFVNQRLVARGEVLVLNDNFCIRVSEIVDDLEEQAQAALQSQAEGEPSTE